MKLAPALLLICAILCSCGQPSATPAAPEAKPTQTTSATAPVVLPPVPAPPAALPPPPVDPRAAEKLALRREWVGKHFAAFTTQDGHTFRDVEVSRADAYSLSFMYADGGFRVPYSQLPEAWQKQLGYDATEANYALARAEHDKEMVDYQRAMENYEAKKRAAEAAAVAAAEKQRSEASRTVASVSSTSSHPASAIDQKRARLYTMLYDYKASKETPTVSKRTTKTSTGKTHVSYTKTEKSLPYLSSSHPEDWGGLASAPAAARKLAAEIKGQ